MVTTLYTAGGWTGFAASVLSFLIIAGVSAYLWYGSSGDTSSKKLSRFWKKQHWRRLMFFMISWIPAFLAIWLFISVIADTSKVWILRITNTLPVGYTTCEYDLVNRGICAVPQLALFMGIITVICNIMWGQFLRLKMWYSVVHILCGALVLVGTVMFELYSDGIAQYIWLGVAGFGAVFSWAMHVYSAIESYWYGKSGERSDVEYHEHGEHGDAGVFNPLFDKLPKNKNMTLTKGKGANSVNYTPFSTAEGWINLFFGIFSNLSIIFVVFELVGPSGLKQYNIDVQVWLFFALTVIFTLVVPAFQIVYWYLKSSDEINKIGKKN